MRFSDWSSGVCSSDLLVTRDKGASLAVVLKDGAALADLDDDRAVGSVLLLDQERHQLAPIARAPAISPWMIFGRKRRERATPMMVSATAFRNVSAREEEHTSELKSLMRTSYAVFRFKQKNKETTK